MRSMMAAVLLAGIVRAGQAAGQATQPVQPAAEDVAAIKEQLAKGNGKESRYNSRPEAMCKLARLLAPRDLIDLLAPFVDSPKPRLEERNTAALVLGRFGGADAVPVLAGALARATSANDRDGACITAWGLGLTGSPAAAPKLAEALKTGEPSVRFRAARSLGMVGGDTAEAALVEALAAGPDRTTRHGAALGLAGCAGAKGLEALRKALADEDPLIRRGAAWAILQRKDAAALKAQAREVWDAPVPPPAYKPRNRQLADLPDNTWIKLCGSPQEAGQNETQWCYDEANRMLFRQSGCSPYYSTEAWALDIGTMTWVKRRPYDDFYSKLIEPTVAPWKYSCLVGTCYDPHARMIHLWGGTWQTGPRGSYDLASDEYVGVDYSARTRWAEAYNPVYDPVNRRCIAFGGVMAGAMHFWEPATGKVFSEKTATPGPGKNFPLYPTAAAAYDPQNKVVVCFTYTSPTGHYSPPPPDRGPTETWTYAIATATWRNVKPEVQPQRRQMGGLAFDSLNRTFILSIGDFASYNVADKDRGGETWRYDVATNTWTDLKPAGGGPGGPKAYRLCYDPEHNVCIGAFSDRGGGTSIWAYRYRNVPAGVSPGAAHL